MANSTGTINPGVISFCHTWYRMVHLLMVLKCALWNATCRCIQQPRRCRFTCLARGVVHMVWLGGVLAVNVQMEIAVGNRHYCGRWSISLCREISSLRNM